MTHVTHQYIVLAEGDRCDGGSDDENSGDENSGDEDSELSISGTAVVTQRRHDHAQ